MDCDSFTYRYHPLTIISVVSLSLFVVRAECKVQLAFSWLVGAVCTVEANCSNAEFITRLLGFRR